MVLLASSSLFVNLCCVHVSLAKLLLQAYVDAVHGQKFQFGHKNHAWLSLDLLEVLCLLSERGHASTVRPMLKHPLEHCPEVLLLGMAHINVLEMYMFFANIFFLLCSLLV